MKLKIGQRVTNDAGIKGRVIGIELGKWPYQVRLLNGRTAWYTRQELRRRK